MFYNKDTFLPRRQTRKLWDSIQPIREELYGLERLEQHALSLAAAQGVIKKAPRVFPLHMRLNENAVALLKAYRASANELGNGRTIVPAAEWLLDNYHLVENQIREARDDLPSGYYRQLPKLASGPFAGYPRVLGLAWAFIAHTDSHIDPCVLRQFINAYQRVEPLTIGELWAVAITLRILLIENLRRLTDQISVGRAARLDADQLSNKLLDKGCAHSALQDDIASRSNDNLSETFAAQLVKRLRDQDPKTTPALEWLEQRLTNQGLTVDDVVQHEQQRQGASNVSIRNVITSMRLISDIDWSEMFESVSLVDHSLGSNSGFSEMDFRTRNLYRDAIEQLSRGSRYSELEVTAYAIEASEKAALNIADTIEAQRLGDPGYHLLDKGRLPFEATIGFRPGFGLHLSRLHIRLGLGGYLASILVLAVCLQTWALTSSFFEGLGSYWLGLLAVLGFVPATEVATALINRIVSFRFSAITLPGLELKTGVPTSLRTLVAVPTLLTNRADILEQIKRLEVHFLTGIRGDVTLALLTDGVDAHQEELPEDAALLLLAVSEIEKLNCRYPSETAGKRFLLLHRRRLFNPGENKWMGWERKRGKLHELNRLLRGAEDTSYIPVAGCPLEVPPFVRYVITLDADTRLPRESAMRLIGKMAHPLNRPDFDSDAGRVTAGYAILQPRVTPSLPVGREGSLLQRVFSSPGGMDPYASATSDVYQDLFGEGSYTGKGIYDVDAFEAALSGRVPDNSMLSHDLFEGIFARAGLVSDVEVVEEFPSRYDVIGQRQHRWTRGDWQLVPWIFGKLSGVQAVSALGRWKLFDNLRRSILPPVTLIALAACWFLPLLPALAGTAMLLATIALPAFLPSFFSLFPFRRKMDAINHIRMWSGDLKLATSQTFLTIVFLPDQCLRMLDAIGRTLVRLFVTRQNLLRWTTAANTNGNPRLSVKGFIQRMSMSTLLTIGIGAGAIAFNPTSWLLVLPFTILWLAAPGLALWSSRLPALNPLSDHDAEKLRLIARRTWRYFEVFVTRDDNMLPPDNFQEYPEPEVAHRTSPTNIGLYLLSAVAAHDFGWTGRLQTVERLEATLATMQNLPRYKGHFFNWYDTRTLKTLLPAYISSVDSGNLAGHLIAIANACEEWRETPQVCNVRPALRDCLYLASKALTVETSNNSRVRHQLKSIIDEISSRLEDIQSIDALSPVLLRLTDKASRLAQELKPVSVSGFTAELVFWLVAAHRIIVEEQRDRQQTLMAPEDLAHRLSVLAATTRSLAFEMDFAFLIDPERNLLSIGFSLDENSLDQSCYDLLASEARLASMFAIAKGDAPTKHWYRLGRTATPIGRGSALISWSGSMFEYLMPSLVMRAPMGSLLEQTNRLVVQRQQQYGAHSDKPWGISESAYNARDIELTYQYSNFGVPGLGLKRGLAEDYVVAPYATGLAAMISPREALENFSRLESIGASGCFGFYEALDFTQSRLPVEANVAIVRSFMAHHQGMTVVAITNTLLQGRMRNRFHSEPSIQSCELLLQERMPRDVCLVHPRAEEVKIATVTGIAEAATVRRLSAFEVGTPLTHLLSNGRYVVMLTAAGAGYSHWRGIAVTRWKEDCTCDDYGSSIFMRDIDTGKLWSGSARPFGNQEHHPPGFFGEDHVEYIYRNGNLSSSMDVLVSGEHDGEVRRISLTNNGRNAREIELTSYSELVLASAESDNAHPAFAKLFVQTRFVAEYTALVATRRKRTEHELAVWAAHFAIVEGEITADIQYETSRPNFIGRNNTLATATAFRLEGGRHSTPLTNTAGTVLDPVFSLRYRVRVPPGGVTRVSFWTVVASSLEELMDLVDSHHDRSAYDRAKTLAWTQAQVQLRHLGIQSAEAGDFQRLAAPVLYADSRFRAPTQSLVRGIASQSELWTQSIAGDLPLVILRIDDIEDLAQVKQLLRAHEYWRMKRLAVDLVIINEQASSYMQVLHVAIETAVRSSQSRPRYNEEPDREKVKGNVHVLRMDQIHSKTLDVLKSAARVLLTARDGPIAKQLSNFLLKSTQQDRMVPQPLPIGADKPVMNHGISQSLEFFNGLGGFDHDGEEYVVILGKDVSTPAPWINVITNPAFGFQVSAEGSGYTWAENSRENQLTSWSNDPVQDPITEIIYVRDENTHELFTATAQPIRDDGTYIARHGRGYSRFEHQTSGLSLDLLQYVSALDPIKISRLTIRNTSGSTRRFSITAYTEWVLGASRGESGPFITTELDQETRAILIRNDWNHNFQGRVGFADMGGLQDTWTTDRTEFLGRNGHTGAPAVLAAGSEPLSGKVGAGHDPCTALQCAIELEPGESREIVITLGQCSSKQLTRDLIARYRAADLDAVFGEVKQLWHSLLGAVQVKTPDRSMDIMLNGWLLYQTIACRIWARSAFYQASGAYGFRDQLQDGMALVFSRPDLTRSHILRAASRQFVAGDVQHWWLPHSGQGVRTRISDDRVWLALATAHYVNTSGDRSILDEVVPFIKGPELEPGAHDAFFQAQVADESATLLEHCGRGLDQCLALTGELGLPLMGTGDWNDGMNRVGEGGRGESVWLGWLLIYTIEQFAPLASAAGNDDIRIRAERWTRHAAGVKLSIENKAWDGHWYCRATFDSGAWLGSSKNEECRIDSIAQSWAVLSGAARPDRAAEAMSSVDHYLVRQDDGLALLFAPPFKDTLLEPGYIKGYPAGLRENGGQYSHAAMWSVMALTRLGEAQQALDLLHMLNPINHCLDAEQTDRYKVEPYVVAADIYSVSPHVGRGGWTWYTGAAGWMYRAGIEGILGLNREGRELVIAPCIPATWPGFEATLNIENTRYSIQVKNETNRVDSNSSVQAILDGHDMVLGNGAVRLALDGGSHQLTIVMTSAG